MADPSLCGPATDVNQHGIANLMACVPGLGRHDPVAATDWLSGAFAIGRRGGLQFRRRAGDDSVNYVLERSGDFQIY